MGKSSQIRITVAAVALLLAASLPAQNGKKNGASAPAKSASAPSLTVDEILRRAIGRARETEQREGREKWLFRQTNLIEKLDGDGDLKERDERTYQVVELDGGLYTRLVTRNAKPLDGKDLKEEQKREQKWRESLAKSRTEKAKQKVEKKDDKKKDDDTIRFDEEVVAKYNTRLLGQEPIAGRTAYIIAFEPKSNDLPARRRMDRVLNKLAGKVWIDATDYEISRLEARLIDRIRMIGGIVASISAFNMIAEQRRIDGDTWTPAWFQMYVDGRIMFTSLHQRMKITWDGHHRPADAALTGSRNE